MLALQRGLDLLDTAPERLINHPGLAVFMRGRSWWVVPLWTVPLALAFSGCVDSGAIEDSYQDADERYTHSFNGGHDRSHTFDVPAGADGLRVALHYDVSGGFTVHLFSPTGMADQLSEGGVSEQKDDSWYTSSNPTPGQWRIQVSAGGTGAYAFGVYTE